MVANTHNKHTSNKREEVRIDYMIYSNSYMIYVNGVFQESLDGYLIEDMKRLKMWERL